ncbi:uncharacterized protein LOC123525530 [Mercenaria mercenaria]|uniref:uncharacterized protein LOC123525530 n=1 Tax=Mercenaria mercenaria TaxID=6596 RepID=UPI00234F3A27|nr:uncharacterized protein LOC123525530 [Mercenaria mercenaria]
MTLFSPLPWELYEKGSTRFWVHYGLVILGFVLAVITLFAQWAKPAPYGKHETNDANWGPMIPQRLGHIFSDALPGVLMFLLVFFFYGNMRERTNYIFLALWQAHYIHRGVIHPMLMRYRSKKVALGITLGGFFPNCLFHFINADFVGNVNFADHYYYDPRFIIGILLYIMGYFINRWADHKLRSLRETKGEDGRFSQRLRTLRHCPKVLTKGDSKTVTATASGTSNKPATVGSSNIEQRSCDGLDKVFQKMFKCDIADRFSLSRTKASYIVSEAIRPFLTEAIVKEVKDGNLGKGLNCFGSDAEELTFDMYMYQFFKQQPVRREDFKDLQLEYDIDESLFLRHVPSRWLTLLPAMTRDLQHDQ